MVRDAQAEDWAAIWPFFEAVVRAAETFTYDPAMSEAEARSWMASPPGRTSVAVDPQGVVLGSSSMGPNRPGPGKHVATASYMVDAAHRGRGVGRALVVDSLAWARDQGFRGLQFNAVAATNVFAVGLYESLGFVVVGTVPEAFAHPTEGFVGLHVMHVAL